VGCCIIDLELQRSLQLSDVLSVLCVGSYIATVAASLVLYMVTAFIDPGFVPVVHRVSLEPHAPVDLAVHSVEPCFVSAGVCHLSLLLSVESGLQQQQTTCFFSLPHSFTPGLKPSFSTDPSHRIAFSFFKTDSTDCLPILQSISTCIFSFFFCPTFLVVGSVQ